jgi:hypothetical protein
LVSLLAAIFAIRVKPVPIPSVLVEALKGMPRVALGAMFLSV